jgi:hypothetical protein
MTRSRALLLRLLSDACELEHGLACSYLYAAFSLKQDLSEGGMTWRQQQMVRQWAAQLYFVAAQEMLHLGQAWNLLAAVGGVPYHARPNFPQGGRYYPLHVPLQAERFGLAALDRFIRFELPAELTPATPDLAEFRTVGELYGSIALLLERLCSERGEARVFVGDPARQVGPEYVDFPQIVRVFDLGSALQAIERITEQGEGMRGDRRDCHYGIFRDIRRQYLQELGACAGSDLPFDPVRPALANPAAASDPGRGAPGASIISDPFSARVAACCDSIYGLMLRMLQWVFDGATSHQRLMQAMARLSLHAMTSVLKPLGEALMCLPAGPEHDRQTAGPPFALTRHVPLPVEPRAATTVAGERLDELAEQLADLAARSELVLLGRAATNLGELARRGRSELSLDP